MYDQPLLEAEIQAWRYGHFTSWS
ncbi:MAG: hypothetical protein ACYTXA_01155 [Nostoc sp.]